jgi:cytochrome c oxidase subunit 2
LAPNKENAAKLVTGRNARRVICIEYTLRQRLPILTLAVSVLFLTACTGVQSALNPAGRGAEEIATLWWWMAGGAAVIWTAVIALAIYAVRAHPEKHDPRKAAFLIIGGGVAFPTLVLLGLLIYGLRLLPRLLEPAPEGSLQVLVAGEQWWWRVFYLRPGGQAIESANEVHLPVSQPVQFLLESPDVIHSFWVPSLGPKMDMIPGRRTRLTLHPNRTGLYRGACAEYCGASHGLMSFYAVVHEEEEFTRWFAAESEPARPPAGSLEQRGAQLFLAHGCGGCHAVRGTTAVGPMGPDLTHVGSRRSVGAGILPNEPAEFAHWIARTEQVKPGVHMPAFGMLSREELNALAAYLNGLR